MSSSMFAKISLIAKDSKGEPQTLSTTGVILAAVCLALIPLDIAQLAFAVIGAFAYAVVAQWQQQSGAKKSQPANKKIFCVPKPKHHGRDEVLPRDRVRAQHAIVSPCPKAIRQEPANTKPVLQASVAPISAPVFKATGLDAEVEELLAQIAPTMESEKAVQQLAHYVQQTIRPLLPDVEVVGFASSNFSRGTAFGVAVPEVDLVATVNSDTLAQRFLRRSGVGSAEVRKLHKTAIRACTDKLVSSAGFKFRRSAFRGHEPKVTMLAPMKLGSSEAAIPVDFAINSATPLSSAALLTECGRMEPKAKSLILLVKRWAKDRGICHVAKGHFSPYAWSLLTIYFLQTGASSAGAVLPPMGKFAASRKSAKASDSDASGLTCACEGKPSLADISVAHLFQEFISFYAADFDWHNEAVSVRSGKRGPPELSLPLHIVLDDSAGTSEAGPSIEDPFEISHNLGDSMNSCSLARLHEEIARAQRLCSQNASLTELLQPWEPEREVEDGIKEGEEDNEQEGFAKTRNTSRELAEDRNRARKVGDTVEASVNKSDTVRGQVHTTSQNGTNASSHASQSQVVASPSAALRLESGHMKASSSAASAKTPPWRSARVTAALAANPENIQSHRQ